MISTQVWKIPLERNSVNTMLETKEEIIGMHTKKECSILSGMGKYITVQTSRDITGGTDQTE